jgi:hypothetical protein
MFHKSLCMSTQIASASAHNASSIFFELPAELRNDIYSYALSHQHPILATIRNTHTSLAPVRTPELYVRGHSIADQPAETVAQPDETVPEVEANQLRYVCKQMWQETKGLSLRYNDIVFWHEPYRPALATCAKFLANVSLSDQRRIRKIVIVEDDTYQTGTPWYDIGQLLIGNGYPIIRELCARNPSTQVILRLDKTCSEKIGTFFNCFKFARKHAALRMVLRGFSDIYFDDDRALLKEVLAEKAYIEKLMWPNNTTAAPSPGLLLLDNLRVTITRRFSATKCLEVRHWYWRSLREFEEGCRV